MSYIVFARKWRPQDFDEVVGQEHITTTLKNAIKQDRVAHAYLFCGPRGIGKTTTARILAKALNCEKGPTPVPCNKCASCAQINSGSSLDIIEIDGATNRGIDEIRNIKENVKFSPSQGRFKVYIIDEVHMLTENAFDALLKTLEEPPPHVKFIFATTAPYKVIPTILSRCQRFNFHKLSAADMSKKLKKIADEEKIKIDDSALMAIIKAASGSMRDAESLLDQLATYCQSNITLQDINKILGTVEDNIIYEFSQYIIGKDTASAIKLINKIIDEGVDPEHFVLSLIEHFRNAMVIKEASRQASILELSKDDIERISKQAEALTTQDILYILYSLINTNSSMRRSSAPKILLELMAVKLSQKESIVSIAEIMQRLSALEKENTVGERKHENPMPEKIATPAPEAQKETPAEDKTPPVADDPQPDDSQAIFYRIRELMPQAIKNIRQDKIYVASCLSEGKILGFRNNILSIGFFKSNSFHKESLEKTQNKKLIEDHIYKLLGAKIGIEMIIVKGEAGEGSGAEEGGETKETQPSPLKKAASDPIIKSALDIFDGNIMKFI